MENETTPDTGTPQNPDEPHQQAQGEATAPAAEGETASPPVAQEPAIVGD